MCDHAECSWSFPDGTWFVHRFEVGQVFGGPEEGGWWYDAGSPDPEWAPERCEGIGAALRRCRQLNEQERERREGLEYGYTSVLSYREDHFAYDLCRKRVAEPFPATKPHYE
jgi:hypothetical protein